MHTHILITENTNGALSTLFVMRYNLQGCSPVQALCMGALIHFSETCTGEPYICFLGPILFQNLASGMS